MVFFVPLDLLHKNTLFFIDLTNREKKAAVSRFIEQI